MLGTASPERHQRTGAVVQRRARRRPAESGAPVLLWQLESKKKKNERTHIYDNQSAWASLQPSPLRSYACTARPEWAAARPSGACI